MGAMHPVSQGGAGCEAGSQASRKGNPLCLQARVQAHDVETLLLTVFLVAGGFQRMHSATASNGGSTQDKVLLSSVLGLPTQMLFVRHPEVRGSPHPLRLLQASIVVGGSWKRDTQTSGQPVAIAPVAAYGL